MISDLSIAVLPFENMSSNKENEYFCDGLSEEIINALTKIGGLKVTSRTSSFFFKGKNESIATIGKELNVAVLLNGSVRLTQNKVRISAQLIEVKNDVNFWSQTWDRNLIDIFDIQNEISLLIADKIRENFGHFELQDRLVTEQTESIEAYKNYLKGQYYYAKWDPVNTQLAIEYFNKAISLDKSHAESYCGLVESYTFLGGGGFLDPEEVFHLAKVNLEKVLSLNKNLPEVYISLSNLALWNEWDIDKTFYNVKKALDISPNHCPAYIVSALAYTAIGQHSLGIQYVNKYILLDPFSANALFVKSWITYLSRDYKQSVILTEAAIEKDQLFVPAFIIKGSCLLQLKKYDDVLDIFSEENNPQIDLVTKLGMCGLAYVLMGNMVRGQAYIARLEGELKNKPNNRISLFLLILYSTSNQLDLAFDLFEKGVKQKYPNIILLISDPCIDNLTKDPRYHNIIKDFKTSMSAFKGYVNIKKTPLLDPSSIEKYTNKLLGYMDEQKPYLDAELTMRNLASHLELHPNKLSWLINESLNKSFKDFINQYRVEYFKHLAKDSKNAHISNLGLAYDSGFNSKTGFYNAFKKVTSLTPSQYLKLNNK